MERVVLVDENDTPLGIEAKSYIEKGDLVPDSVTINMLKAKVNENPDVPGYIFDGFPRTIAQAEALDNFLAEKDLAVSGLLALDVPDEELIKRLLERGKDSGRADDQDESIIANRIETYNNETAPVFDYYGKQERANKVDGVGDRVRVAVRCRHLDSLRQHVFRNGVGGGGKLWRHAKDSQTGGCDRSRSQDGVFGTGRAHPGNGEHNRGGRGRCRHMDEEQAFSAVCQHRGGAGGCTRCARKEQFRFFHIEALKRGPKPPSIAFAP